MQTRPEVLVVDDNRADLVLIKEALRACGFDGDIATAEDGEAGLDVVFNRRTKPDLILLDINMPVLDGHGMLQRLRTSSDKRTRDLPVVIMSSSTLDSDINLAYELGANAYMSKPADYSGLMQAVSGVLQTFLTTARTSVQLHRHDQAHRE
jgi:CheY-like chemotaxis protein